MHRNDNNCNIFVLKIKILFSLHVLNIYIYCNLRTSIHVQITLTKRISGNLRGTTVRRGTRVFITIPTLLTYLVHFCLQTVVIIASLKAWFKMSELNSKVIQNIFGGLIRLLILLPFYYSNDVPM